MRNGGRGEGVGYTKGEEKKSRGREEEKGRGGVKRGYLLHEAEGETPLDV